MQRSALAVLCAALASAACSSPARTAPYPEIDPERIRTHIERLTAAEDAGAAAGTHGEQLAAAYLTNEFGAMGLHVDTQTVPMTRITPRAITFSTDGTTARTLRPGDDFVAWTRRREPKVDGAAEMVFAGYGISAERQGWDDYKGIDVRGKIVLLLSGDPLTGKRHRLGPAGRDVYGSRDYKFQEAARRGALGAFLIHRDDRSRPWQVVRRESSEVQDLNLSSFQVPPLLVEGWMTTEAATAILAGAGGPLEDLVDLAEQANFQPVALPLRATVSVASEIAETAAINVVATLEPRAEDKDEAVANPPYVLYSTHWNDLPEQAGATGHLRTNAEGNEPPGAAVMLEVARALARETPRQGYVFLVVTAESDGLLGLDHYLEHSIRPLAQTRAGIHIAGFGLRAAQSSVSIIGPAHQSLKVIVREATAEQFRGTTGDTSADRIDFYRSASVYYSAHGVPSIFLTSRPPGSQADLAPGEAADLSVAVHDARLFFHIGRHVAQAPYWPGWKPALDLSPHTKPPAGAVAPPRR